MSRFPDFSPANLSELDRLGDDLHRLNDTDLLRLLAAVCHEFGHRPWPTPRSLVDVAQQITSDIAGVLNLWLAWAAIYWMAAHRPPFLP